MDSLNLLAPEFDPPTNHPPPTSPPRTVLIGALGLLHQRAVDEGDHPILQGGQGGLSSGTLGAGDPLAPHYSPHPGRESQISSGIPPGAGGSSVLVPHPRDRDRSMSPRGAHTAQGRGGHTAHAQHSACFHWEKNLCPLGSLGFPCRTDQLICL